MAGLISSAHVIPTRVRAHAGSSQARRKKCETPRDGRVLCDVGDGSVGRLRAPERCCS